VILGKNKRVVNSNRAHTSLTHVCLPTAHVNRDAFSSRAPKKEKSICIYSLLHRQGCS